VWQDECVWYATHGDGDGRSPIADRLPQAVRILSKLRPGNLLDFTRLAQSKPLSFGTSQESTKNSLVDFSDSAGKNNLLDYELPAQLFQYEYYYTRYILLWQFRALLLSSWWTYLTVNYQTYDCYESNDSPNEI
jgi:hypothetical protein